MQPFRNIGLLVKFLLSGVAVLILAASLSHLLPRLQAQAFSSPFHDVDNPARQPIFFNPTLPTLLERIGNVDSVAVNVYQVPAGKRLVITYIGFYGAAIGTLHAITVTAHPAGVNPPTTSQAVAPLSAPVTGKIVASQQVFLFGNPGDQIDVALHSDSDAGNNSFTGSMIAGYLVNLP
jgi:hypothetical protein